MGADLLLMDEKIGRRVATHRGLRVVGLLGVLVLAKDRGLLRSVADTVAALESQAGFFISPEVRQAVLQRAGEA
jgi:predicted nucleic acid-binding protein